MKFQSQKLLNSYVEAALEEEEFSNQGCMSSKESKVRVAICSSIEGYQKLSRSRDGLSPERKQAGPAVSKKKMSPVKAWRMQKGRRLFKIKELHDFRRNQKQEAGGKLLSS
jgi:hypothetical protein